MLKSTMELYDILFPQNAPPLTYKGPAGLRPGTVVRAELKKTLKKGVLLGPSIGPAPKTVKEISDVLGDGPAFGEGLMGLLKWMSEYYFTRRGIALKEAVPPEFLEHKGFPPSKIEPPEPSGDVKGIMEPVFGQAKKRYYRGFLFHADGYAGIERHIVALASALRGVIILLPEIHEADYMFSRLPSELSERAVLLHSKMRLTQRREALFQAASGAKDIVIGCRQAVFAPIANPSLIVVIDEESPFYKKEEGLAYNTRDVAVMRAYLEGSSALLCSLSPSVESYHNAMTGKYTLIRDEEKIKPKKARIIKMRFARRKSPHISKDLYDRIVSAIGKGGRAALVLNRKGYSILRCGSCGHVEECGNCRIALVYHKSDKSLRCHYCGYFKKAGDTCAVCNGHELETPGGGLEKLSEELSGLLKEAGEKSGKDVAHIAVISADTATSDEKAAIVLGTKAIGRRPELRAGFDVVGIINADGYLNIPDFRASERAFSEITSLREYLSVGGELIVQTWRPEFPIYGFLRSDDYEGFYEDEIKNREELGYPPFTRLALVTAPMKDETSPPKGVWPNQNSSGIEVLGPASGVTKKGRRVWKALVKAKTRKELHNSISRALERAEKAGVGMDVEVDPISV